MAVTYEMKASIRREVDTKGSGWLGFCSGNRPRRVRVTDSEMESLGWTAWKYRDAPTSCLTCIWYNTDSDEFSTDEPTDKAGDYEQYTRKCPGCDTKLELSWCSQYCSRSCMYSDTTTSTDDDGNVETYEV